MSRPAFSSSLAPASDALLGPLETFGVRLGLERMRRLLAALGDPHLQVPAVLIAGTNGKGSTSALLASIVRAAGYRTGLYTSPHLESVCERLVVDGQAIADAALADHLRAILALARELGSEPPTYFEAVTLAAFRHFHAAGVELMVLEVGLGGRLDATNVSEPMLSIITAIGLDHEEQLGHTLAQVAREKAGILRRGRPAIIGSEAPEVERTIGEQAAAVGAELVRTDARVELLETSDGRPPPPRPPQRLELITARERYVLELPLAGPHQHRNLGLAVTAAEVLAERGWPRLTSTAITAGVAACRWPARLEWVRLPGGRDVLLDGAHNPAGVAALTAYLATLEGKPALLFGVLADKDAGGMLPPLAARAAHVVLTRPDYPRSADPHTLLPLLTRSDVTVEPDPATALAVALASPGDYVLVCGSLYLVGGIRRLLGQRFGVPRPAAQGSSP